VKGFELQATFKSKVRKRQKKITETHHFNLGRHPILISYDILQIHIQKDGAKGPHVQQTPQLKVCCLFFVVLFFFVISKHYFKTVTSGSLNHFLF